MRKPLSMGLRFAAIVLAVTTIAIAVAPPSSSGTPYLSALSNLAGTDAGAAGKKNCNSLCERVFPGYTCLHEGSGTKCVFSNGCTTVAC